ncbi:hypothetical protein O181_098543 [Austropuccinia psidii MF-1]|uniref:Uncharacterized protein n=1 Tax=Austropuccinia psidii MF-1 TaxID=1389203 RepID=A0A9Q3PE94_9BASI|nr:hypothetical protein [Austropuccinia psidii MF-1]
MRDAIRVQSDEDQDPREEFLVEYQDETQLEIQDIQLESEMPEEIANKNLCKHTQDAQTFLVTPTKGMAYIHGTATKNVLAKDNLDNHFPNWEKQLLPTKAKDFESASWKMTSIGLNPELVVLEDACIHGFLLGTDYQRMYGIDIYNSKNRQITIGTNKEKKFSLEIYHMSTHYLPKELLNEFIEGQFSTSLTKFAIGEGPLGKIRGNDMELYLDVERPYPPMMRRPQYPASLETGKEIEKHMN